MAAVRDFLPCPTPEAWVAAAAREIDVLLLDHANCERKAAATAMSLLFRYERVTGLPERMSRLAREELRHYEQVLAILAARRVALRPVSASRYAGGLRDLVRSSEPGRLLDLLLCGALVEARSCERFAALLPVLGPKLSRFYQRLLASEARHFEDYLELADSVACAAEVAQRLVVFKEREAELITTPDPQFRFHSGVPARERARSLRGRT
ncbi:MAG: tRNA-(ms[2]io[6]A)-hydroxylase [Gammaproteobacteria bacterium]|nr:tRNA-(ms[2]io[6]A)-hydroxylase [Gammaproteobacteria bacterium]